MTHHHLAIGHRLVETKRLEFISHRLVSTVGVPILLTVISIKFVCIMALTKILIQNHLINFEKAIGYSGSVLKSNVWRFRFLSTLSKRDADV